MHFLTTQILFTACRTSFLLVMITLYSSRWRDALKHNKIKCKYHIIDKILRFANIVFFYTSLAFLSSYRSQTSFPRGSFAMNCVSQLYCASFNLVHPFFHYVYSSIRQGHSFLTDHQKIPRQKRTIVRNLIRK